MKIKEIYRFAISKKWICRQRLFFEYIDKGILIKFTEIRVNIIEKIIKEHGNNLNNVFVFPSRIASMLWFQKSLPITGLKTIPAENYISWDVFKEQNLVSDSRGLTAVSQIVRSIFAAYMCKKNSEAADGGAPLFKTIIPAEYAKNGSIFSEWLAGVLPQLDHFEKRCIKAAELSNDEETSDYLLLKEHYGEFLQNNSLFEPSWFSSEFFSHGKKYFIIYPELMEDFSEHAELLNSCKEVTYIQCPQFKNGNVTTDIYSNARSELRSTVLQIEKLLSENVSADEIAVSVPDIDNYSAYIKREFELRNIPIEFRSGFNLGKEQAGKLFSLIYDCVQNNYSFEFLKPVILSNHIPWKNKSGIQALIEYGVKNNCAVSWKEKSEDIQYKNIWIESFKINYEYTEEEIFEKEKAKEWFYNFYYAANKMYSSKTFDELQKNYFIFIELCINSNEFSEKDNAILGRCISVLQELLYLEKKIKEYMPKDIFKFFVSQLEKEIYVPKNTGCAVSVFPYRVAAGTPFHYHFVLNCSQKYTGIIYDKLSFLRKDKREVLGVFETDASSYFFHAYSETAHCIFSFTEHSFDGYLIINSLLENEEEHKNNTEEKIASLKIYDSFYNEEAAEEKMKIYKMQKIGADTENDFKYINFFSYIKDKYENRCRLLSEYITENQFKNALVKVSQTDLKDFYICPSFWLLKKILKITSEEYDASIFNVRNIGILCHEVLKSLYSKIQKEDVYFNACNIEKYKTTAEDEFNNIINVKSLFKGALAKPFIQSLKQRVLDVVNYVLQTDALLLNGYTPKWVEEKIEFEDAENNIYYNGQIDRVSFPAGGDTCVIIDYKTNNMPAYNVYGNKKSCEAILSDFQIPMYVFLTEKKLKTERVEHAWFLSFVQQKINMIINDKNVISAGFSPSTKTREEFQPAIDALILYAKYFAECVRKENFTKSKDITFKDCSVCIFKNICRETYSVK